MSVHLFTRSCYTFLKSTIRIEELVTYAKQLGYTSVALTDHNVMYGATSFIRACKAENIHPIVGMEVDCMYHDTRVPFVLLSKDNLGYQQLMELSSFLNEGNPTCTTEQLLACCAHCHLIAYGEGGWIDSEIVNENYEQVRQKLLLMKQELKDFDIGLSYMEASLWKSRNKRLKRICQSLSIPTVALNKIYYLRQKDAAAHRILRGIAENKTLHDSSLTEIKGRYYLSQQEMTSLYDEDDLERSEEIARSCRADYVLEKTSLPQYPLKQGIQPAEYLKGLCEAGLKKRLHGKYDAKYMERLRYELSVIIRMHFENYFLIVYDFICHARKNNIYIGPGRGSAAGSLVAYCLGITMIDPMQYHLLFERFLNPERISMPDIDTDIPDNKRSEVIHYVYEKYGEEHVCNIVTFGTLGPRQVLRDVAKVMNFYGREVDMIIKLIPNTAKMTLQKAYDTVPRLKQIVQSDDRFLSLFQMAVRLEGLPRQSSVHAGGILLSQKPLHQIVPTTRSGEDIRTCQYSMEYLEERGLIKMDFLGLRNLSVIDEIVKKIQEKEPTFHILSIPMNDSKTYAVFSNADTLGVFQFESEGIKSLLRRMQPKNILEIADAMALYRPGPMDNIRTYLQNKQDISRIQYVSSTVAPILKQTYGVMIYQEQIMMIAQVVASFSLGKADILRKAISKKKVNEMENLKKDFIDGALKNGYTEEKANILFQEIEKFAGYGFNKSHAVAYAHIAYQMAYLKANYPYAFYTSLLDSVMNDIYKTAQYVDECRRRKIQIFYPSVNESMSYYTKENQGLRLPLSIVKGIGFRVSEIIVKERSKNGKYIDIFDFVARCHIYKITQAQITSLIDSGSLDCFHETRMTLKSALEQAEAYADVIQVVKNGQTFLNFDLVSKPTLLKKGENESVKEEYEREALGFTLGPSRIIQIRQENHIHLPSIANLLMQSGRINGFAVVREVRTHRTKKGNMMAFIKLSDETGEMNMMVMPRQYEKYAAMLVKGAYAVFYAKIQEDGSIICDSIQFVQTGGITR